MNGDRFPRSYTRGIPILEVSLYSEYSCTTTFKKYVLGVFLYFQTILEIVLEKLNKREGLQRVVYCRSAFVEKEYGERRRKN